MRGSQQEGYFNFKPYMTRFFNPNPTSSAMYYSYDYGNVHFVSLNTENTLGLVPYDFAPDSDQVKWLDADLRRANANRAVVPWIVLLGHRPAYCSSGGRNCNLFADGIRRQLEPLLLRHRVDLAIWAHQHNYERTYPVLNNTVTSHSYVRPPSPVHILNGAGGNKEHNGGFTNPPPPWAAFRSSEYGYGLLTAHNASHMTIEFRRSADGTTIDSVLLVRNA